MTTSAKRLDVTIDVTIDEALALVTAGRIQDLQALLAQVDPARVAEEPELTYLRGHGARSVGDRAGALEIVRAGAPACAARGNDRWTRRCLNLEAVLHFELGRMAEAEEAWLTADERAAQAGDDLIRGWATMGLGSIASLWCDWSRALATFERSIAALFRVGAVGDLARSHLNVAVTLRELGRYNEASGRVDMGMAYARAGGRADVLSRALLERGQLSIAVGDLALADVTLARALELARASGDPLFESDVRLAQAAAARCADRLDDARGLARRALDTTEALGMVWEQADAQVELAKIERLRPAPAAAAAAAAAASRLFTQLGAKTRAERARALAGARTPSP